jgi:hypothetical protein
MHCLRENVFTDRDLEGLEAYFHRLEHPSTEELAESNHSLDRSPLENPNKALLKRVWVSEKGWCRLLDKELLEPIRGNSLTAQLAFEELTKDGSERMWGPLIEEVTSWDREAQELLRRRYGADVLYVGSAELMVQDAEEAIWYGPSCGDMPETVGRRGQGDAATTRGRSWRAAA